MPELGKYAATIHWAWAITLAGLAFVALLSWVQARAAKRKFDAMEARRRGAGDGVKDRVKDGAK